MTPIILNNQGCTAYPNGTAGDPLRAVEFRVMLRGADAPPAGSGPFRITIEPQPPPTVPGGTSGPAEPPSPTQESSGPETASAWRSGAFSEMASGPELETLKLPELPDQTLRWSRAFGWSLFRDSRTVPGAMELAYSLQDGQLVIHQPNSNGHYVADPWVLPLLLEANEPDPLEGLPPLAEGSRWRGWWLDTGSHSLETDGDTFVCDHGRGGPEFSLSDVRHLLARHDREHGIETHGESDYQIDRLKALASDLLEPWRHGYDPIDTLRAQTEQRIAHRILAIIDDLRERGVA